MEAELLKHHPGAGIVPAAGGASIVLYGETVATVNWLNWQGERGVGYDIEIMDNGQREFVEVKSTVDSARACFDVTAAEWSCARDNGPRYRIFRVFNAGRDDAWIGAIRDSYGLWQSERLSIRPVQIEL